ncbi:Trs33p KNAG_0H03490 [Huiozyma naganishii CBS 8797]|uniref:Trafficking protein particle complex subunit n=1 Tax=Huiozyma naganishii (strain ATCC MYA-139 / BCRC 22969 / CBS 8797 / KCTC 17520 / NBRC 10181 / NCYC 3082 / Yp74L-3) TaxID=1071383 RepID=J7RPU0_HUIN7|nr:hypothetical protein KNAG_0H03490 [Kazachstania naganishii CBS 8797]CCK71763.1 hypothetical protein KNAG_0H03490 [Kazachstania naganishii CBS 8797]
MSQASVPGVANDGTGAVSQQRQYELEQEAMPKLNRTVFQMVLNEIIPMAYAVEVSKTVQKDETGEVAMGSLSLESTVPGDDNTAARRMRSSVMAVYNLAKLAEEDEDKYNSVLKRIESLGTSIGSKISDMLIFAKNPSISFKNMDLLSVMKFICRDVWKHVFGKQIDNLKTNHRGTFYLIDLDYAPIQDFTVEPSVLEEQLSEEDLQIYELKLVEPFLQFPVGIIKGVLHSLGHPLDKVVCLATYADKPKEKSKVGGFPKGINFHVQITNN